MASGSFQSNTGVNCNIRVEWTSTSNVADNTSTVKVKVYLVHNALGVGSKTLNINCLGSTASVTTPAINTTATGCKTLLADKSFTISHGEDGSKSGTISASIPNFDVTYAGKWIGTLSTSDSVTLDTIPRATVPTVSPTSVIMGNSVTISMPRASSSFTHTLTYSFGTASGTIGSDLGTSKTWEVPTSLASAISNAASGTCTITCKTYSGSNLVGTKTCSLKLTIPQSSVALSVANAYMGDSVTITANRVTNNLTHTLTYSFGSSSGSIGTGIESSKAWTVPTSLANAIENASSGKCTITCKTYNGTALIGSSTAKMTLTIPTTVPTLSASSIDMGNDLTISMPRVASGLKHTLTYKFGSTSGTIGSNLGTSKTWTVPLDLANQIPDTTSGKCEITCKTYNGTASVGSKTVTFTAKVPASVVPTISNIACTDPTSNTKYEDFVQSKSKVYVNVSAAGAYSSTITSYKIVANGTTYTSNRITTGLLKSSGSNTISVEITDSRGRKATLSTTITVLAYTIPTISTFKATRCNSSGSAKEDGTYIKATMKASITALNNKNSKKFTLQYKKTSDESWTTLETYTSAYEINTSKIFAADTEYSYDVRLTAKDDFTTSSSEKQVATTFTLLDFNASGKGISFGKVSEKNAFECNLDAEFKSVKTQSGVDLDGIPRMWKGLAKVTNISSANVIDFDGESDLIIGTASHNYKIDIIAHTSTADSCASYFVRSGTSVTTSWVGAIYAGENSKTPVITLTDQGKLNIKLKSYTSELNVSYIVTKIY